MLQDRQRSYIILFTVKAQTSLRILRRSRKFRQRESDFDNGFFLVYEGRDDQIPP